MMRGRIVKIGDVAAEDLHAKESAQWVLEGDRGVTFAATPPKGSTIVAGHWWPADYNGPPLVSLEAEIAEGLGLKVGDTLTVNVLGRNVTAKVANFRKVELAHLRDQFRAGVLARRRSAARPIRCSRPRRCRQARRRETK